jgi:hypothetical protein
MLAALARYMDATLLTTDNDFRALAVAHDLPKNEKKKEGPMTFSPDTAVLAVSAKDTTVLLVDVRKVVSKP